MDITIILLLLLVIEVTYLIYRLGVVRKPSNQRRSVFVDTSALMDGRIVTAAQTGFIPGRIVIPKSVVSELQLLADQADHEKRSRARRGLDAVGELQALANTDVEILNDGPVGAGGVDERLIELATKYGGSICTIDFNLNKVAKVHKIFVLNINELAGSIRMAFLPGETISLKLTQKGQNNDQAVGYLADGTMVVVDKSASQIGKTVQVEFIRSLQTAAGRMMFARVITPQSAEKPDRRKDQPVAKVEGRKKVPTKQPQRQARKKASGEDSLIELVNNQ